MTNTNLVETKPKLSTAIFRHAMYYLSLASHGKPEVADLMQIRCAERQLSTGKVERLLPLIEQRTG